MKKIILISWLLFSTFLGYSQCNNLNTPAETHLITNNLENITIQLCREDTVNLMMIRQYYLKSDLTTPKLINNVDEGNFLLKNSRSVLFTTDNSKFKLKFIGEDTIYNPNKPGEVCIYSYYEITRTKLKFILLGSVESIHIIKELEIQSVMVSFTEAKELYSMTFYFFKWMKWK